MIFITKEHDERPLFTGFVNGIIEKDMPNGGKQKTFIIGTSEKKMNSEDKIYSSWFATMIGKAKDQSVNLTKGNMIKVYGFKMTNVSMKNEDGTYGKAFLNVAISDFEDGNFSNQSPTQTPVTEPIKEGVDQFGDLSDQDELPF